MSFYHGAHMSFRTIFAEFNFFRRILTFSYYKYATVTTRQGALFIGGYDGEAWVATVACYNNAGWSRLDDLQSTRVDHRAIINGDKVYVIGGQSSR